LIKVKDTESKTTPSKRTITIKDAIVNKLQFVDETGDITNEVLERIPEGVDLIDLKITIELDEEE
jgi:hypothetical protein